MERNNRSSERYKIQLPVALDSLEGNGRYTEIETKDISSGGVFIETSNIELAEGSPVQVELTLSADKLKELFQVDNKVLLKIDGLVTRRTDTGIAVKFSDSYSIKSV